MCALACINLPSVRIGIVNKKDVVCLVIYASVHTCVYKESHFCLAPLKKLRGGRYI